MRQFLFVVAMIGAAFLGGVVVNGPGLRWVQARLLDYMGLQDGGEIASIDLPPASTDPADPHRQGTAATTNQASSPAKPARSEPQSVKPAARNSPAVQPSRPESSKPSSSSAPPPLPVPTAIPEPVSSRPALPQDKINPRPVGLEPPLEPAKAGSAVGTSNPGASSEPTPAPLDPGVGQALLASRSPSATQPTIQEQPKPLAIALEPAPGSSSFSTPSSPVLTPPSATPKSGGLGTSGPTQDWAALRSKMQSLGVTRYTIEGDPGGRVVFWCLIPLAGRQAVSQRFEGEGDDEFHAAQAAIRRIALWQATRQSSGSTAP